MDPHLQSVKEKVMAGERLDRNDALTLFHTQNLFQLGRLANSRKEKLHGNGIYFGVSLNINHTNICELRCPICAFSTDEEASDAFLLTHDEIISKVSKAASRDISEVHIVGGLHDKISLSYFKEMFSSIKKINPSININALTATECEYLSRKENLPLNQLFQELKEAGLGSIPGGGAEILKDEIRQKITPLKSPSVTWLEVSRAAHQAGIRTNATVNPARISALITLRFRSSGNQRTNGSKVCSNRCLLFRSINCDSYFQ